MNFRLYRNIFIGVSIILSNVMCILVSYNYCALQWGGKYEGYSAPPEVAFIFAIPFLFFIGLCIFLSIFCNNKIKK